MPKRSSIEFSQTSQNQREGGKKNTFTIGNQLLPRIADNRETYDFNTFGVLKAVLCHGGYYTSWYNHSKFWAIPCRLHNCAWLPQKRLSKWESSYTQFLMGHILSTHGTFFPKEQKIRSGIFSECDLQVYNHILKVSSLIDSDQLVASMVLPHWPLTCKWGHSFIHSHHGKSRQHCCQTSGFQALPPSFCRHRTIFLTCSAIAAWDFQVSSGKILLTYQKGQMVHETTDSTPLFCVVRLAFSGCSATLVLHPKA